MKKTIGNYLLERLKSYNIKHIFGVPGDYNLGFLDQIDDMEGIEWIGNCNELNGSYAADGYGRINGMSALLTTAGVGELSAINGIAGAYAESIPVVNIVGIPSRNASDNRKLVHHTLGDGEFFRFYNMFKEVTVAQTILNQQNAKEEIDRVLRECYLHKKPVYIAIPVDVPNLEIESYEPTEYKLLSNEKTLNKFINDLKTIINNSKSQYILADYLVNRYKLNNLLKDFVEYSNLPIASLSMGKSVINESHKNFMGIYSGILSDEKVTSICKESDVAILIGVKLTDSITAGFKFINDIKSMKLIEINPLYCRIGQTIYNDIFMEDVLKELINSEINFKNQSSPKEVVKKEISLKGKLTQEKFFKIIEKNLIPSDVLLAEQGTSFFGASTIKLPDNAIFVGQPLWGSIGYTFGSLLGTSLADKHRRNILLIGDGSFQLTAQELSTMLREDIKPIIIVINNDGYTVERLIHGATRKYNDINMWNYRDLLNVFDSNLNRETLQCKIQTVEELDSALIQAREERDKLAFFEVIMDKDDAPKLLKDLSELFSKQNSY